MRYVLGFIGLAACGTLGSYLGVQGVTWLVRFMGRP